LFPPERVPHFLRPLFRVHEIAYGFGGLGEKKCQSLAKSAQILLVMSDRTDKFHELLPDFFITEGVAW